MNHLTTDSLIDYLHGELSPDDDARTHAHLATCATCRGAYEAEIALTDVLRASACAVEREMPSLVAAAVWERVRAARPSPLARLAASLRPIYAIPVAAAVLAIGFFASPLGHPSGHARSIDAAYYLEAHAAQAEQTPLSERAGTQAFETSMVETDAPLVERSAIYAAGGGLDAVR